MARRIKFFFSIIAFFSVLSFSFLLFKENIFFSLEEAKQIINQEIIIQKEIKKIKEKIRKENKQKQDGKREKEEINKISKDINKKNKEEKKFFKDYKISSRLLLFSVLLVFFLNLYFFIVNIQQKIMVKKDNNLWGVIEINREKLGFFDKIKYGKYNLDTHVFDTRGENIFYFFIVFIKLFILFFRTFLFFLVFFFLIIFIFHFFGSIFNKNIKGIREAKILAQFFQIIKQNNKTSFRLLLFFYVILIIKIFKVQPIFYILSSHGIEMLEEEFRLRKKEHFEDYKKKIFEKYIFRIDNTEKEVNDYYSQNFYKEVFMKAENNLFENKNDVVPYCFCYSSNYERKYDSCFLTEKEFKEKFKKTN